MVPKFAFSTKGRGTGKEKLTSFEMALRDASIATYNLVKVSSIMPPNCKIINKKEGLKKLSPGQIVFVVLSECSTNEPGRKISSSVGIALPDDRSQHGYLSEHHAYGQSKKESGEFAEDLAAYMLATTLGAPFDSNKNYNEQKDIWKISGHTVTTQEITSFAEGPANKDWITVVTAIVLII
ncbi:arginine decarboxylase, pyruvoyl-dependent [bacterium]|jgi:arginine decarboxylase|nr:arginine decarboxylase, pyruvoyl-dependent [bacterium]MBT3849691.1 arginine decarboxylase, pyruvoyl-dependent [bacterium]MBT4435076.1 arginine decarboxylase, pyruvoyl-dependent [bacterium]MDG2445572.1 arginine decarboxylase, pyruvoyl-dependent [Thermodesulfobacteriota bacterium]|tara:strand:+ start:1517 stop:2059 length:543 start_codon:yes stop_codon:yes gene_type:complete